MTCASTSFNASASVGDQMLTCLCNNFLGRVYILCIVSRGPTDFAKGFLVAKSVGPRETVCSAFGCVKLACSRIIGIHSEAS